MLYEVCKMNDNKPKLQYHYNLTSQSYIYLEIYWVSVAYSNTAFVF